MMATRYPTDVSLRNEQLEQETNRAMDVVRSIRSLKTAYKLHKGQVRDRDIDSS